MRIRIGFIFIALLFQLYGFAQTEKCGTMALLRQKLQADPGLDARMAHTAELARQWRETHPEGFGGPLIIPVVVHVLYTSAADSIPASRIYAQLDVLNHDYRRLNADTADTRPYFKSLAADVNVEFCLAASDPNGNFTTGIEYVHGNPSFGFYDPFSENAKSSASGGADPWPADHYLNLWVCNLFPGLLGYAQFPGDNPATDGVVIHYQNFGTGAGTVAPGDLGRTATHEVGHWLGLYHIWGDGDCTVDDSILDTPDAVDANYTCDTTLNTCIDTSGTDYPDMIENFMDYSPDSCMSMFTEGQKDRIWSFLLTSRSSLAGSGSCLPGANEAERQSWQELRLYPNPTNGPIRILAAAGQRFSNIRIFDMKGIQAGCGSGNSIETENLPAGVYRVLAEDNNTLFSGQFNLIR